MITDNIENIDLYNSIIPNEVIKFIKNLNQNTELGKYQIDENIYANIEMYNTKPIQEGKFESHKQYCDIQILLKGEEYILYQPTKNLKNSGVYRQEKDIMFYLDKIEGSPFVKLDGTNFALIYPHEAHAPQIATNVGEQNVIKVVVKIKK